MLLCPLVAAAQAVSLAGVMGQRALLLIDGQTQTVAVGDSARGVKLLQVEGDTALVQQGSARLTLRLGGAPASVGAAGTGSGSRTIVIPAGPGGHFFTSGAINGRAVQFMVDTGATTVAMGQADAERLGVDWQRGDPILIGTANGSVPGHRVVLTRVRVGEVEIANVTATVTPVTMPHVLLGNSFLGRFSMQRDADVMRLVAR